MPAEVVAIGEQISEFGDEIGAFFRRSATDKEGLEMLLDHRKKVFQGLNEDFEGFSDLISSYPSYGATALIGMIQLESDIDKVFEKILNDGTLLMDYSIEDIRPHIKIEKGVVDLARQIISLDESVFMMIVLLLWSVNKQIPALKKLGK